MALYLLTAAVIIGVCVLFSRVSGRLGIPALLAFIVLGMLFGSDGIVKIPFENYKAAEQICSIALIFIMFYGGAGINLTEAKKVAGRSVLLSSLGTVLTAAFVGMFCKFFLKISGYESFLIGAVICSTDAASVFSILRSKKLALKYNTASILEMESGSNDPFSYMLTVIILTLMSSNVTASNMAYMLFAQVVYAVIAGVLIAYLALFIFKRFSFITEGFDGIFMFAIALLSFALPSLVGGNGYLATYICGIILGNNQIKNKKSLIHFFDGITGLMQMLLFFLLGLLSFPSQLGKIAFPALCIALFLTFVARPLAVSLILTPAKCSIKQQLLISWSGMRGAASIVFAIMTVVSPAVTDNDIFHIVFFIVLFSILIQGSLIPFVAKKLNMIDPAGDVMKTFSDYSDELPVSFIQLTVSDEHHWVGKTLKELNLPRNLIAALIVRDSEKIIPKGNTILQPSDKLILCGRSHEKLDGIHLFENKVTASDTRCGKRIFEVSNPDELILMIKRKNKLIIPDGNTTLSENDVIITNKYSE